MRVRSLSVAVLSVAFGAAGLVGCDEKMEEQKKVDVKSDGTVVEEKRTVTEKADGTIVEEKSTEVDRPDRDRDVDDKEGVDAKVKVKVDPD